MLKWKTGTVYLNYNTLSTCAFIIVKSAVLVADYETKDHGQ
jgi:hypothetical protein